MASNPSLGRSGGQRDREYYRGRGQNRGGASLMISRSNGEQNGGQSNSSCNEEREDKAMLKSKFWTKV